jgi:hypothetical protein
MAQSDPAVGELRELAVAQLSLCGTGAAAHVAWPRHAGATCFVLLGDPGIALPAVARPESARTDPTTRTGSWSSWPTRRFSLMAAAASSSWICRRGVLRLRARARAPRSLGWETVP